ncbi:glyoxylase-like metal-dependent hydrolase (beta-lactamase superfamily II) [Palleronia aestuarii]|uniref:Glyoxylase-like metal-dependent hydrolase (Beta-lactamase superfamily II) n=1 Tax=Palleronia aestuarii TaxID=568105 RepID=A0A2W7N377_9RHOB|nr:MBL fold metallo-hydrolase [Palleronia aestuarii]PZX12807.1 glyoxylase-like metal-dependent hydrolase (beta-lactamase superfamily II) [Palleronia aestuarii]
MVTRRGFVGQTAFLGFTLLNGGRLWSATETDLGDAMITTLSDGHLSLPESFLFGDLDRDAVERVLGETGASARALEPPCNLTLFRANGAVVLFDAGSGPSFMPSAGKLPAALNAAGVSAEDVTHVVFTHAHPDHLWGVLDDFDEPVFANAQHLMGGDELAYWSSPDTLETISPERQSFAAGAARRIEILGDRLATFDDAERIIPGITSVMTPGHTPGHMSFEIAGDTGRVFLIGDAIGNDHVAFAHPEWHAPADQDPETGARTRLALFERLTEDDVQAVGFHLPSGGLGRIVRSGDRFDWDAG